MRRFFFLSALFIAFIALTRCDVKTSELTFAQVSSGDFSVEAVPEFPEAREASELNRYYARIRLSPSAHSPFEVYRTESGASPIRIGSISSPAPALEDRDVKTNTSYEYSFRREGESKDSARLSFFIPRDLILADSQTGVAASLGLERNHTVIRVSRLLLKKNLYLWTFGRELIIDAEEIVAEEGATIGVTDPKSTIYSEQTMFAALMKEPGRVIVRTKRALGLLTLNPVFPKFVDRAGDSTEGPPSSRSYIRVDADRKLDPNRLIIGSQEMHVFVDTPSTLDLKINYLPLKNFVIEEEREFRYRPITLHRGNESFVYYLNELVPLNSLSGIYRYRQGRDPNPGFIDLSGIIAYHVVSPLRGHMWLMFENGPKIETGEWEAQGVGILGFMFEADRLIKEGVLPPDRKSLYEDLTRLKGPPSSELFPQIKELQNLILSIETLSKKTRPQGIYLDFELEETKETASYESHQKLIDTFNADPEVLIRYCRANAIHSVIFHTSATRSTVTKDRILTLTQNSAQSPHQLVESMKRNVKFIE